MTEDLDIQSWPEIPTIAHFCSLFREAFGLIEFDMEQLEESLLLLGSEEEPGLVLKLIIKLLGGCLPMYKKRIKPDNFSKYLVQLFQTKLEEAEEDHIQARFDNPFSKQVEKDFNALHLKDKVVVLHQLCEYRLEAPDVGEKVKNLDAASLRVEPLGVDSEGSTLWYFYGTRLYKETATDNYRLEKKRKKKHKKEKKRKRKKSSISEQETESTESDGGLDTADSSQDADGIEKSSWSVVCITIQDWEELTEKYRGSSHKEDRRLYKLIQGSFLPEIKDMFKEKEKEARRKEMENLLNTKRSSSRIETLKKTQEEKDRLLAIQLAEQAEAEMEERRGRKKRGRVNWDEEESLSGSKEDNEGREERARQREIMKEMREKRAAEKIVEERFKDDVVAQKLSIKESESYSKHSRSAVTYSSDLDEEHPLPLISSNSCTKGLFGGTKKVRQQKDSSTRPYKKRRGDGGGSSDDGSSYSSRDSSPSSGSEDFRPTRKNGPVARASFATALLKAGTKSTKDSNLEKVAKLKDGGTPVAPEEKKPIRQVPGHLLQTAGKGLINCNKFSNQREKQLSDEFDDLIKPKAPTISFGLYGGHLAIDKDKDRTSSRSNSTDEDNFSSSLSTSDFSSSKSTLTLSSLLTSQALKQQQHAPPQPMQQQQTQPQQPQQEQQQSTKRVFSNWGGEFFKKNLDYRANTNKILEKMQLNKTGGPPGTGGGNGENGTLAANGSFSHS